MTIHPASPRPLPADVREFLAEAAETRRRQLDKLPTATGDMVAVAHRASVQRILEDVLAALERCENGTYGQCLDCGADIPIERLELRPWAATCTRCSRR